MNEYVAKIKKLMEKEMVRYVIAGGMTTAVNLVSFFVLRLVTDLSRSAANIIAIMLAILFAYFANGFYVFRWACVCLPWWWRSLEPTCCATPSDTMSLYQR